MRRRELLGVLPGFMMSGPAFARTMPRAQIRAVSITNDYEGAVGLQRLGSPAADSERFLDAVKGLPDSTAVALRNLTTAGLREALGSFIAGLGRSDIVILHYAGHGFRFAGTSWILMQDGVEAVSLLTLLDALQDPVSRRLLVAFIDACGSPVLGPSRELAFHTDLRASADQPASRGAGPLELIPPFGRLPPRSIVVLSAQDGRDALARPGGVPSPFALAVAARLREKVSLREVIQKVLRDFNEPATRPGATLQEAISQHNTPANPRLAGRRYNDLMTGN